MHNQRNENEGEKRKLYDEADSKYLDTVVMA